MPEKDRLNKLAIAEASILFWKCTHCDYGNTSDWKRNSNSTEVLCKCRKCHNISAIVLPGQRICGACNGEGRTLHAPCAGADVSESFIDDCSRCCGKGYV